MSVVNDETIRRFSESLDAYMKRLDITTVVEFADALQCLVHDDPETAALLVSIYCQHGQNNPVYLQGALLLASAYYIELRDYSLVQFVEEEARLARAVDSLTRVSFLKDIILRQSILKLEDTSEEQ